MFILTVSEAPPNPASAVDAPIASLFHSVARGRRATDQHRSAHGASKI